MPYVYVVWHPIYWWGYTVGWYPTFHLGWYRVTIGYWVPIIGYRAVNILVRRDMVADPVTVNAASVDQYGQYGQVIQNNPSAFRYDAMGSLREQFNDKYHKAGLYIVGGVALCVIPGGAGAGLELVSQGFFLALTGEDPNIGMSPTAPKIVSP